MPVNLRTGSRQRPSLGKTTTVENQAKQNVSPTSGHPKTSIGLINQGTVQGGMSRKSSFAARSSSRKGERPVMSTSYYK